MPASHVCPDCGTDLARLHALPDPHYGLRLVRCPRCERVCVRARDPLKVLWRSLRVRAAAALLMLGHGVVLLGMAIGFAAVAIDPLTRAFRRNNTREQMEIVIAMAILAGIASFWLGLAAPHRRLFERAGVWISVHAIGLACAFVFAQLLHAADLDTSPRVGPNPLVVWAGAAAGSLAVIMLTEPLVMLGRAAWRVGASGIFRLRRRRAKILRSGV